MEMRIIQFVAALRNRGVRVSLAESKEAFQAVKSLGITDKEYFRLSLRVTMIKDQQSALVFDELFPVFFGPEYSPDFKDAARHINAEQARIIADEIRQYNQQLRKMLNKMILGQPLSQQELEQLSQLTNLSNVQDPHQLDWKQRQMLEALQFEEVRKALNELVGLMEKLGMDELTSAALRQDLNANQEALEEQLRQFIGQQIMQNISQQNNQVKIDELYNRSFQNLSDADMRLLRHEVNRLAAILRTRLALRLKRAKTGKLDVKSTLRGNLKYGSVPLEIRHKNRIRKPKIVILCDVSTSMRHCSELMISLIYAIQDQISKTHAFAYIDHLEFISPELENGQAITAVSRVLQGMPSGHYNTDLGNSLNDFSRKYLDAIDHRSTFIVVGDGRNNFNDPHVELFMSLARRSQSTIWINPEEKSLWGTGDSDMLKYAAHCSRIFQAGNLRELSIAINRLFIQE